MSPKITKTTKEMKGEVSKKKKRSRRKTKTTKTNKRPTNIKNIEIMKSLIREGEENQILKMITAMTKKLQQQTTSKHEEIITETTENNKMYVNELNLATKIKHPVNLPKMNFKKVIIENKNKYLISNRLEINMDNTSIKALEKELTIMIEKHLKIITKEENTNVSYNRIKENEIKKFLDTVNTATWLEERMTIMKITFTELEKKLPISTATKMITNNIPDEMIKKYLEMKIISHLEGNRWLTQDGLIYQLSKENIRYLSGSILGKKLAETYIDKVINKHMEVMELFQVRHIIAAGNEVIFVVEKGREASIKTLLETNIHQFKDQYAETEEYNISLKINKLLNKNYILFNNTVIFLQGKACHKIGLEIKKGKEEITINMSETDTDVDLIRIIKSGNIKGFPDIESQIEAVMKATQTPTK